MRYLVICKDQSAFFSDWYDYENCWNPDTIRCVIDQEKERVTFDGKEWKRIEYDHL